MPYGRRAYARGAYGRGGTSGPPGHSLSGALTVNVTTAGNLVVSHPLTGALTMVTITAASSVTMAHPLTGGTTVSVTMAGNLVDFSGASLSGALTVSVTAAATKLRVTNPGPYVVTGWTTTAGSTTITGGTATAADVGATVTGPGIPPGTTIVSVTP